jgi:hypothetical protein
VSVSPVQPPSLTPDRALQKADELFAAGRFAEAEATYRERAREGQADYRIAARLGHLALLDDRLGDARRWLERALAQEPAALPARALLAEAAERGGAVDEAARHLRAVGRHGLAGVLERLRGARGYRTQEVSAVAPLTVVDPLPVVAAEVDGVGASLVVDTGCGLCALDTDFAAALGLQTTDPETAHFAGGRAGAVRHALVGSLALGGLPVTGVPVQVYPLRAVFAAYLPAPPVDGILGTALLYRFRATLDLPQGALRLEPRRPGTPAGRSARDAGGAPLWLGQGYVPLVTASLDALASALFFLDTGMSGATLAVPRATAEAARLRLLPGERETGLGGGGPVGAALLTARRLGVGGEVAGPVRGLLLDAFPLERQLGFRVAGLLGFDLLRGGAATLDFDAGRLQITA